MTRNLESLPQLATKIHALERKTIASTIEIGHLLQVAFDRFEHGDRAEYHKWVETEFAWSERTARRYRELYEFQIGHSVQFDKLNVTVTALYYLAGLSKGDHDLPEDWVKSSIEEVIREAEKKKRITREEAGYIVTGHISKFEAKQAQLDAAAADEPEPEADADPEPGPEGDAGEVDADEPEVEPEFDTEEPPGPNELSQALEIIHAHGMYSPLWVPTAKVIEHATLLSIIETLNVIAFKQSGDARKVDDALKSKADRAEARSRATSATVLQFPAAASEDA